MADEDRVLQAKLVADLDNIVRIARERGILLRIVGFQVGAARADMIEKDDRNLSSNAGDTCRHMFWSQPKPCAKIIAVGPLPAT